MLGKVVTKLSKRDDFTDRWIRCWCNLNEIESAVLSFTQGVGQFQDAELLTGRT